jgi:hypothetical protein
MYIVNLFVNGYVNIIMFATCKLNNFILSIVIIKGLLVKIIFRGILISI